MDKQEYHNKDWEAIINDSNSRYNRDIINWTPIYEWVIERLPVGSVVDVGCGLGHFLADVRKDQPKIKLIGMDVSDVALTRAAVRIPDATFLRVDCEKENVQALAPKAKTFTFLQVVEHLHNDLAAVESLRKGANVFISVPEQAPIKDSEHVRFYPNEDALRQRFEGLLDIKQIDTISQHRFIVMWGVRR